MIRLTRPLRAAFFPSPRGDLDGFHGKEGGNVVLTPHHGPPYRVSDPRVENFPRNEACDPVVRKISGAFPLPCSPAEMTPAIRTIRSLGRHKQTLSFEPGPCLGKCQMNVTLPLCGIRRSGSATNASL